MRHYNESLLFRSRVLRAGSQGVLVYSNNDSRNYNKATTHIERSLVLQSTDVPEQVTLFRCVVEIRRFVPKTKIKVVWRRSQKALTWH